jgi:hypothetical protein
MTKRWLAGPRRAAKWANSKEMNPPPIKRMEDGISVNSKKLSFQLSKSFVL